MSANDREPTPLAAATIQALPFLSEAGETLHASSAAIAAITDTIRPGMRTRPGGRKESIMSEVYAAQSVGASYCASCTAHIQRGLVMICVGAQEYCPVCAPAVCDSENREKAIAALLHRVFGR